MQLCNLAPSQTSHTFLTFSKISSSKKGCAALSSTVVGQVPPVAFHLVRCLPVCHVELVDQPLLPLPQDVQWQWPLNFLKMCRLSQWPLNSNQSNPPLLHLHLHMVAEVTKSSGPAVFCKDMTTYQRVLFLKLGTTHPTSQNSMECLTQCGLDHYELM